MNLLEVQNIYELYWTVLTQQQYQLYAGAAFLAYWIIKSLSISISGYKRPLWSLLIGLGSCVLTTGALFFYLWREERWIQDFLPLFGIVIGAFVLLDIILVLATMRKSSFVDGLVGTLLGNTLSFSAGIIFYLIQIL